MYKTDDRVLLAGFCVKAYDSNVMNGRTLYAVYIDLNTGWVVHDVEVFHPNRP